MHTHTHPHTYARTHVHIQKCPRECDLFPKASLSCPGSPPPSGCVKTEGVMGQVLGGWRLGFTWLSTFVAAGQQKGNVQEGSCVCLKNSGEGVGLGRERWMRLKLKFAQDEVEVHNSMDTPDRRQRWGRRGTEYETELGKAQLHSSAFSSWPCGFCAVLWPASVLSARSLRRSRLVTTQREESPGQNSKLDPSNIPLPPPSSPLLPSQHLSCGPWDKIYRDWQ